MAHDADAAAYALDDRIFADLRAAVREAGDLTMQHFRKGSRIAGRIDWKAGNSPVTEIDLAVDRLLKTRLTALLPEAGWLSEETADTAARLDKRAVIVVDPIDGTRGFMEGDQRFSVSVAVVVDGLPVAAVVDAPALGQVFSARRDKGAFLNDVRIQASGAPSPADGKLAGPKFLVDPVARKLDMAAQPKVPSLALRFVQVAAAVFDAAIASTDAHDWDIAAADLILTEAGAQLRSLDGGHPVYNRRETKHAILVAAPEPLQAPIHEALRDVTAGWRSKG